MKALLRTVLLTLAVVLSPAAAADADKPAEDKQAEGLDVNARLTDDDPLDKVRTNSHCKVYPLKMVPEKVYTIDLRSEDFDSYLRVEDANGKNLAEDDDSGDGLNSRLVFLPPRAETYRVVATSLNAATGAFHLTVRPSKTDLAVQGQLNNNDPFDKLRPKSHCKVHELKLVPGQSYTMDLRSNDFDAYLRVENSKGENVAEDDDSGGGLNARVVYTPTQEDTYHIIVTTFNENETGNYTLTVIGKKE